jgi:RNA polymerase sigma factor (sigma-70 family)
MNHYDRLTDDELLGLARSGDRGAYGELYARHADAGRRFARRLAGRAADDVVAEAFTKVLGAIHRGKGPSDSFRLYLFAAIRTVAQRAGTVMRRTVPVADFDLEGAPDGVLDDVIDAVDGPDRSVVLRAFGRLTRSQQEVLWYLDAEQRPPGELTDHFGLSANAISARAYRARQALRRSFLELHFDVPSIDEHATCEAVRTQLAQHLRGQLDEVARDEVDEHLEECPRCRGLLSQVAVLAKHHGAVVPLPALVAMALTAVPGGGSVSTSAVALAPGAGAAPRSPGGRWPVAVEPVRLAAAVVAVAAVAAGVAVHLRTNERPTQAAAPSTSVGPGPTAPQGVGRTPDRGRWADDGEGTGVAGTQGGPAAPSDPSAGASPAAGPASEPDPEGAGRDLVAGPGGPARAPTLVQPALTPPADGGVPEPMRPPVRHLELEPVGPVVADGSGFVLGRATAREAGRIHVSVALEPGLALRDLEMAGGTCGLLPATCEIEVVAGQVVELVAEIGVGTVPSEVTLSWWGEGAEHAARAPQRGVIARTVEPIANARGADAVRVGGSVVSTTSASLVRCAVPVPDCPSAAPTVWRDDDLDPATAVSAAADLPAVVGGPVRWARLYWAGELAPGGGVPAPQPDARDRARLRSPTGAVAEVAADEVRDLGSRYLASADVTDLVAGAGRYEVADVQLGTGIGAWGAWVLVVIRAPEQPSAGATRPVVVASPFRSVGPGAAQAIPLVPTPGAALGPLQLDVVAFGATPDRPGTLRWSEADGVTVLGGRSGAHGATTTRLDHETMRAVAPGYGALEVGGPPGGEVVVGVVLAREAA